MDIKLDTIFGNPNLSVIQYPGFADDFNAPDGPLIKTLDGEPWETYETATTEGVWVRTSGKAKCNSGSGYNCCVADAGTADGTLLLKVGAAGTGHLCGAIFRAVDMNNCWYVRGRTSSSDFHYQLFKVTAGTVAAQSVTGTPPLSADGDEIRVELSGSSISVKINGANVFTRTDSYLQTATKHGLFNSSVDFTPTYDQVEFVPFGESPVLTWA